MKKQFVNLLIFFFDFLFIVFFYFFITKIRGNLGTLGFSPFNSYSFDNSLLFIVIIMLTLLYEKIYILRFDFWEEAKLTFQALFLSFVIILSILMLGKINQEYSRSFVLMYFAGLAIALPSFKRIVKNFLFQISFFKRKVKIVGNKEQIEILEKEFKKNWYFGFEVVKEDPDTVFIASKDISLQAIDTYLRRYSLDIKDIYILPYMTNINFSQSQIVELFNVRTSVIKIENNLLKKENLFLKEFFEKVMVIIILPLFLLIHILISTLIIRDSKGSVFFKQKRLGKDNKLFECLKYRTMLENSDEILNDYLKANPDEDEYYQMYHKYKNDPRITKIGNFLRKLSLDELPQIINVLKAEMSLIGPRPYMPVEAPRLKNDIDTILRVKPGISGLWQVSGRSELSFDDRKKLDIWYIQNWSLWMDIVILIKTFKVVLLKTGAK